MDRTGRKAAALRKTKLFGSLDEQALSWLAVRAEEQYLTSGEMLFFAGEPATGLFVVVDGTIRAFQQNSEGREQVMHVDTTGATLATSLFSTTALILRPRLRRSIQRCFFLARPQSTSFVYRTQSLHSKP